MMYERILVGTDGSERSMVAVESALKLAELTGAELHVVEGCGTPVVVAPFGGDTMGVVLPDLMDAADIREYQQIDIYNVTNGERFTTYAIRAQRGSGVISVNGAAAHKASPGDILIIASYAAYSELELHKYHPKLVYVDERNRILAQRDQIPVQAA